MLPQGKSHSQLCCGSMRGFETLHMGGGEGIYNQGAAGSHEEAGRQPVQMDPEGSACEALGGQRPPCPRLLG